MDTYKLLFVRIIAKWSKKLNIDEDKMRKVFTYVMNTNTPSYLQNNIILVKLGLNISRRQLENFAKEFKKEMVVIKKSPERVVSKVSEK